jgi:hypothetical protein
MFNTEENTKKSLALMSRQFHQFTSIDCLLKANSWSDYQNEPFVEIDQDWAEYKLHILTSWIDYNLKLLVPFFLFFDNYKKPDLILQKIFNGSKNIKLKKQVDGMSQKNWLKAYFKRDTSFMSIIYDQMFTSEITLTPLVDNFLEYKHLNNLKLDLRVVRNFIAVRNIVFHKYYTKDDTKAHVKKALDFGNKIKKYFDNFIVIDFGEINNDQKKNIINDFLILKQVPAFISIVDLFSRNNIVIPPECLDNFLNLLKNNINLYTNGRVVLNGYFFKNTEIDLNNNFKM